jgi:hypothetical protein
MSTKNILTIQTVQIAPFRTLMMALKDILIETETGKRINLAQLEQIEI